MSQATNGCHLDGQILVGVQGPLKDPGSSQVFEALSCYLTHIFMHFDTNGEKHSRSKLLIDGRAPAAPTLDASLCTKLGMLKIEKGAFEDHHIISYS